MNMEQTSKMPNKDKYIMGEETVMLNILERLMQGYCIQYQGYSFLYMKQYEVLLDKYHNFQKGTSSQEGIFYIDFRSLDGWLYLCSTVEFIQIGKLFFDNMDKQTYNTLLKSKLHKKDLIGK